MADELDFDVDALHSGLRAAGIGVWSWDARTDRVRWSRGLEVLFGIDASRAPTCFEEYSALIHPDDRQRMGDVIQRALREGAPGFVAEHRVHRPDGELRWLECRGHIERDPDGAPRTLVGTATDVTARQQAGARLRATEEILRVTSELASDYVYVVELDGERPVPLIVAGSFERTTGYTLEQIATLGGWIEVVHPDDRPMMLAAFREPGSTPFVNEYRIVTRDGQVRWLRDHGRLVRDGHGDEAKWRVVGSVSDVTDRKRLEEQLVQAQKMEALARLAGGVAHDFNNLLTVILGGLALLDGTEQSPRAREGMAAIETAAERMTELTRSLLALGRRQISVRRRVELDTAVRAAAIILERAVDDHARIVLDLGCLDTVNVDAGQLQLVLLNLVVNARDAMPHGGEIALRTRAVELGERDASRPPEVPPGRYARIDVVDRGAGIEPARLRRVFEPFFTTKDGGMGLGLAVSYGIVSQHGGALAVQSELGRGTTFSIHLPIDGAPSQPPAQVGPARGGTERVLLVEDDNVVRTLAARALAQRGYVVLEADSAEAALALPAEELARVELLLSDVRMPGADGTELAARLLARHPTLPVLLMSGYAEDASELDGVVSGRYGFLAKPFTPDGLARRVRETLDRGEGGA